jgi:hypothetical protein
MRKGDTGDENGKLSEPCLHFLDAVQINTLIAVLPGTKRDDFICQYPSYLQIAN